jgi:hypothetical protein
MPGVAAGLLLAQLLVPVELVAVVVRALLAR